MAMLNTRCMILDAQYHDKHTRTEINILPNRVYTNNVRLSNLGVDGVLDDLKFNALGGVYTLIDKIFLMNGSDILASLQDADKYLAFNSSVVSENAQNFNVLEMLNSNNHAYAVNTHRHTSGDMIDEGKLVTIPCEKGTLDTKGILNLSRCFPLLLTLPNQSLDTYFFNSLRVVIEWKTGEQLYSSFQREVANKLGKVSIKTPQLLLDEIVVNPPKYPSSFETAFYNIENEKFYMNKSTNPPEEKEFKTRSNLFNNKIVERLLLSYYKPSDEVSDDPDDRIKDKGSRSLTSEKIQLYLDGASVFDFGGVNNKSYKSELLSDCYGSVAQPLYSNVSENDMIVPDGIPDVVDTDLGHTLGRLSYMACFIRQRVNHMDLEVSRKCQFEDNDDYIVNLTGEVIKVFTIKNGEYMIGYA